jgi:hypothetical protein
MGEKFVIPIIGNDDFLICRKCGNYREFIRNTDLDVRACETEIYTYINGRGNTDYTNYEERNSERVDYDPWECSECNADSRYDVQDFGTETEIIYKFILEHVNKDGFWSEKVVEEVNKEYESEIVARRI